MTRYEYAVVPAPKRGTKVRGVKTTEDRFAFAIQTIMNEYGSAGWEYLRTDTLPCEERSGLTGRVTTFQNMLVFRKPVIVSETAKPPAVMPVETPLAATPVDAPAVRVATTGPAAAPMLANRPLDNDPDRPDPKVAAG